MSISTVRTIISDFPQYVSAGAVGDGFTTEYVFPYAPITAGTLKVYFNGVLQVNPTSPTPPIYTENDDLGVVVFTNPPALGVAIAFSSQATLITDTQISTILAFYSEDDDSDSSRLAAADCLEIIASAEALIQKKIKMLDLEVDGPALAKSLRDHAKSLRDNVLSANESSFDVAERVFDRPGWKEKIVKDWMRTT